MRTLYLNNNGSRWRNYDNSGKPETAEWLTKSGQRITRTIKFWESFGNFTIAGIKYNNKVIKVFPDTILEDELPAGRYQINKGGDKCDNK
jgi:hypothetical protein